MPAIIIEVSEAAHHLPMRGALLGLDVGTKTIGVATSDAERRLATGVENVSRKISPSMPNVFWLSPPNVAALVSCSACLST